MACVYTLKYNNSDILKEISEAQLREYITNNSSEFEKYSDLSIRYLMDFDEATNTLKNYNTALYEKLKKDRRIARTKAMIKALHPEIEASEDWGSGTMSILKYSEQVANQYIDGFNLENWKKNKALFYELHREELFNVLPLNKDLDLINMPKEQLSILINLALEKEMKSWDYRASLGKGMHYIMSVIMNSNGQRADLTSQRYKEDIFNKMLDHMLEDDERGNYIGNNKDVIMKFIDDIVDFKFKTILFGKGNQKPTILTDFIIEGTTSMGDNIRGKIDLLVLYPDGSIDIYDLKTSTTNYLFWDANKKKIYQYQLGYYKRLLSTLGFSSNKINIHIIPAKLSYDKNSTELMSDVSIQELQSIVNSPDENTRINSDIKLNMSVTTRPIINNVEKKLTSLFSKISFIQGVQGRTRESIKMNFMSRTADGKFRLNNIFAEKDRIKIYDTEEEVEKAIDLMLELSKEAIVTNVAHITNLLKAELSLRNNSKNKDFYLTYRYGYQNPVLPANFAGNYIKSMVDMHLQPYRLEAGWEVVASDDFTNMGVIVLVNQYTKHIDIISVLNNDPKLKVNLDNGGDTLLGLKSTETSSNEMLSNIGNIEIIKQLSIIDELLQLPEYSEYKVNALKQLSMVKNTGAYLEMDVERAINTYKKLCSKKSLLSDSNMLAVDRIERAYIAYLEAMKISSDNANWRNIEKVDNTILSNNRADKDRAIRSLLNIRDSLKSTFFKESNPDSLNTSPEAYLFNLISTELAFLQNTGIDLLNSESIDKYGLRKPFKNRSLLNGTDLNSIDTIPIIRGIYTEYFKANKEIRRLYTEQYKSLDTKETKKFYDDAFSLTSNKVVNAYALSFKALLDTSEEGKKRFMMKNPYDPSSTLNDVLREYAKYWLVLVNAYRYNLNPEMLYRRDKPISEIIKIWEGMFSDIIAELRYSGKYFEIPLANASSTSMILNKKFNIKKLWKKSTEDITNPTDNILNNEDSEDIELELDQELSEMYDHFNSTDLNEEYRKLVLQKGDPTLLFETNLELVKDMYIFSKIRKLKYDVIIPSINNALVQLAYVRKITGKASKELEQFIVDFMRSSVFNKHLISKNMTPFIALVNLLKKLSSIAILGGNYMSGIKETMVGYLELCNRAFANMSNAHDRKYRYSESDMQKAYMYVWKDAINQVDKITLLEHLNRNAGISNVDVNSLIEESNYNRASLGRFSNRMFWNNRAPDFLNRMTIVVSYMMKYGIMDAYKVNKKTGMIEYDWHKDKRFERFAKNDLSNKTLYNDLKALYNRMKREFVEDGYTIIDLDGNARQITMDDDLPDAFTTTENKKLKSESDIIFGYMDHDVKSLFFRRAQGVMFGQFLTYLTAKKNQWFLTRKQYGDGHWQHMTNEEGLKLYFKYYEHNGKQMTEITTEVTDDPVWDWKGDVYEGIFWSLCDLSSAFYHFDRAKIKEMLADPVKRRNLVYALNDLFYILVLMLVGKMLTSGDNDNTVTKTCARLAINIRRDINPIETFKGVADINITSLNFAKDLISNTWELATGDTNILKYLSSNVGALRPLRYMQLNK